MKFEDLKCVEDNVNLDDYLKLYKYVRDNMEHPEWLGTFTKNEIIDILDNGGKIWLYYNDKEMVCSCFYIPSSNKSLNKHNIYYDEKITGSLGPIMVSPDYVGNGFQTKMQNIFNEYNIELGNRYIFTKVHSDNIYSIRNIVRDGYIETDEYLSDRGMNKAYVKDLFNDIINDLEYKEYSSDYISLKGNIPILFTAPHTMKQLREDGSIKLNEPYTKGIALYLNKYFNVNCMIKLKDTGIDSNNDDYDEFKTEIKRFVKDNNIKLVIDLHGASIDNDFDVEFGTMNNLSSDFSTVKELEEAFTENGITNIKYNDPFKGGAITRSLYELDVDVIQMEINSKYRQLDSNNLELLVNCLSKFINQYKDINRR